MPLRYAPLLLLLAAAPALAQPFASAARYGGPGSDVPAGVAVDGAGNAYVAGTFEGTADFGNGVTLTSAGDSDAFLVKFDAAGVAQWARRAGTDVFNDFGEAVAVAPSLDETDAVYVAGTFTGVATWDGGANPDTSITTFSDFDAFLAKYDAAGDLQWVRRVGGTLQDVAKGVAVMPAGSAQDVFLVGSFTGTAEAGDTTLVSAGGSDAYLARYTADGEPVWARRAGGSESDAAYDVAVTYGGDAFVVGQFYGVAVFGEGVALQSVGLSDIFVARYGGDGAAAWAERLGGSGSDFARGVALDGQGEYDEPTVYVGGAFSGDALVGADVLQSAGFTDILLAALDADGDVLWGRRGGGPNFDFVDDVQTFPAYAIPVRGGGNTSTPVYVTGYIDGSGTFDDPDQTITLTSAGDLDGFLAAYEAGGEFNGGTGGALIDAFRFGGPNRDQGYGIAILPQAEIGGEFNDSLDPVLVGSFRDTASFGFLSLESAGSNDGFLARLTSCPSLFCLPSNAEDAPGVAAATLAPAAPNPFSDRTALALTLPSPERVVVEAFDVLGRRVATLHEGQLAAGEHRVTFDAAGLPGGVYVVRAEGEAFRQAQRVTLVR